MNTKTKIKIDKFYCINLDEEKKRWNNIKEHCKKAKIKLDRFSAINANKLNLNSLLEKQLISNTNIKLGGLANTLSHTLVWKEAQKKKFKYIIVLEDDCKIPADFWSKIALIDIDFYFDILFLGGCFVKGSIYKDTHNIQSPLGKFQKAGEYGTYIIPKIVKENENANIGFFAYILNCNVIGKLINQIFPYKTPIDICIRNMSNKSDLVIYYSYPHIVEHDFTFASSRLSTDYNKKFYSDRIKNNYNKFDLCESVDFIVSDFKASNIDDIKKIRGNKNDNNVLILESNCVLQKNAFYFIKKYTQLVPKNWSILIISNKNIVKTGRVFICNYTNNDKKFYMLT